jgi:hypothetical protein
VIQVLGSVSRRCVVRDALFVLGLAGYGGFRGWLLGAARRRGDTSSVVTRKWCCCPFAVLQHLLMRESDAECAHSRQGQDSARTGLSNLVQVSRESWRGCVGNSGFCRARLAQTARTAERWFYGPLSNTRFCAMVPMVHTLGWHVGMLGCWLVLVPGTSGNCQFEMVSVSPRAPSSTPAPQLAPRTIPPHHTAARHADMQPATQPRPQKHGRRPASTVSTHEFAAARLLAHNDNY